MRSRASARRALPTGVLPAGAEKAAHSTWQQYGEHEDGSDGDENDENRSFVWKLIGPSGGTQPGILSFSGATSHMSGRVTALAITPECTPSRCRLWVAAAGGGVWRTENPFAAEPKWVFVSGSFKTNAIGTLDQDPNDPTGNTLYAGTGEPNASGDSEAGVGIYKTTNGGDSWTFLSGSALFASRSIGKIVIDPVNRSLIYVGITRGVRGISSVSGGVFSRTGNCVQSPDALTCRDGPDQAPLGLYRSKDGGATFTLLWDANLSIRGVNDVGLDPSDHNTLYVAAFQRGIWRCSAIDGCDLSVGTPTFRQVFRPTSPLQIPPSRQSVLRNLPAARSSKRARSSTSAARGTR